VSQQGGSGASGSATMQAPPGAVTVIDPDAANDATDEN
jgi:hypothetical protein